MSQNPWKDFFRVCIGQRQVSEDMVSLARRDRDLRQKFFERYIATGLVDHDAMDAVRKWYGDKLRFKTFLEAAGIQEPVLDSGLLESLKTRRETRTALLKYFSGTMDGDDRGEVRRLYETWRRWKTFFSAAGIAEPDLRDDLIRLSKNDQSMRRCFFRNLLGTMDDHDKELVIRFYTTATALSQKKSQEH